MIIACFTAMAATLPGVFLVLRGVALMSDAISHAILPGIVLMFLLVKRLNSPWLFVGAALAGFLLVIITEAIVASRRLKKEVAIGLVFPLFFSLGVIAISRYARDIHLDADMVLLGDIVFTPFSTFSIAGIECGPYALVLMGFILILNAVCLMAFYKELVLATFDKCFAQTIGLRPQLFYNFLMLLTSMTAVAAFDVVGSIVVVALMIVPAATAWLLTNRLEVLITLSLFFGLCAGAGGYWFAHGADVSIAGSIALMAGFFFIGALCFAPQKGLVVSFGRRRRANRHCAVHALKLFLAKADDGAMPSVDVIARELGWSVSYARLVVGWASA